LYVKEGQVAEEEMFSNNAPSEEFEEFLKCLGDKIPLAGWSEYRGGLDVKNNTTGTHSIYTGWKDFEIMFHVSTMLPFSSQDKQQLERKRHLGNDIVVIIFKEGKGSYAANTITSEFNHVFIVVHPVKNNNGETIYKIEVVCKEGVPSFKPRTLVQGYTPSAVKEYLLTKLINAERAAYDAPSFAQKIHRTKRLQLQDIITRFS